MEKIGARSNGNDFVNFKKQMKAVAAADFTMGYTNKAGQAETLWAKPVSKFSAWTVPEGGQLCIWPAEIELSGDYYNDLLKHAVPHDARALISLKHSALALDAYFYLTKRLRTLTRPTRVAYAHFHEQFGQEYASIKDFSRDWKRAVKTAMIVYPMAKVTEVRGGLMLEPSAPPVSGQAPKLIK